MSVILVGYRGCGKTTVGQRLAERLGWAFEDTDVLISEAEGKTIREIFGEKGEAHFRELESRQLQAVMDEKREVVVATGGGIVMREENRRLLRRAGQAVVYLHGEAELLLARIRGDAATAANRPNLTALGGGLEEVRHLLAIRDPLYREVATWVVEASDPAGDIVDEIIRLLGRGA